MKPYFEEGGVTLYHGDALEVLPNLEAGTAYAVVTDPPYVIGAVSAGNMASKSGGWADMMNSALWFSAWYRECDRILKHVGMFWSFCNWRTVPVVMRAAAAVSLGLRCVGIEAEERHCEMVARRLSQGQLDFAEEAV